MLLSPQTRRRPPGRRALLVLLAVAGGALVALAGPAHAGDVCSCGAGDAFDWAAVDQTVGGAWQCSGDDGIVSADDHFRLDAGCQVTVTGDVLQVGGWPRNGIEVEEGGELRVHAQAERRRVALGAEGLVCRGRCELRGVFRTRVGTTPAAAPSRWIVDGLEPCGGDCAATPEQQCFGVAGAQSGLAEALASVGTLDDLSTGTRDWLCLWDFDKTDARVSYDDNACYPVTAVDATPGSSSVCVDVRQGRDDDYPHRLRQLHEGTLAAPLHAGDGCGYVLDAASGLVAGTCGGSQVRLATGGPDPVQADGELVGRFLRLGTDPESPAYKIVQTFDCAAQPALPHPCGGSAADVAVLGSLDGVASAHASGSTWRIDYGWRVGDEFFVMAPVQLESATPAPEDSVVDLAGTIDAYGLHVTDLGGGGDFGLQGDVVMRVGPGPVERWRHVIVRNDTGFFVPNTGVDLLVTTPDGATLGHTNIVSNTGHGVLLSGHEGQIEDLVLEDFTIRHHGDGCFNHSFHPFTPEVTVRRAWCAFPELDAESAQWFAWQAASPDGTLIEDSACDACDAGHTGVILRSNAVDDVGWTVRRALLWSPAGALPGEPGQHVRNSLWVGFRGGDGLSATLLPAEGDRLVARFVDLRTNKLLLKGTLDFRDSVVREVSVARGVAGVVSASDGSRVRNVAFVDLDTTHADCVAGDPNCVIAQEAVSTTNDVVWQDTLFAWTPGRDTGLIGALRYRATGALVPPTYDGVAIAHHDYAFGSGTAFTGVRDTTVGTPTWDDGPCFFDNDADVDPSALPLMPPETSQGVPLGFVDPAAGRFDVQAGSQADLVGCGLDRANPPGQRGYHYVHARTGLRPELMGEDADGDGWPGLVPAPACLGTGVEVCRDNCEAVFNPGQEDADADGAGDACEPQCSDGLDNDGDGQIDHPDDPHCASPEDDRERAAARGCGLGFEAGIAVALLATLERRRRRAGATGPLGECTRSRAGSIA